MEEFFEPEEVEILKNENRKLRAELAKYKLNLMTNSQILNWLAENINTYTDPNVKASVAEIQDMLNNQIAVSYLLIWPIFESRHFGGFMKLKKIDIAADMLKSDYDNALKMNLDPIAKRFFERYSIYGNKNNPFYKGLQPDPSLRKKNQRFEEICSKRFFINLNSSDKIYLLLYVIYRYRNNIFHGYKNIESWSQFTYQINDCLTSMMLLSDYMKAKNIIISEK